MQALWGETMRGKRCFFIGHREASDNLLPALRTAIEQHIVEYGVTEFLVGRYGGFDRLAAQCVIEAKQSHPEITLTLLLPYHPFERKVDVLRGFDGSCYPPGQEFVPRKVAIVRANRYAADYSDYLIAYVWHTASNARSILEYAEKQSKAHITCLSGYNAYSSWLFGTYSHIFVRAIAYGFFIAFS